MIAPLLAALLTISPPLQNTSHLYRTVLMRAAPGELLEVIRRYKERMPVFDAAGEERPLMMRHSQGDQWDLLLLFPLGSFADYYSPDRIGRRERAERTAGVSDAEFQRELDERLAWREDLFVWGPALAVVKRAFAEASFFHVEMFIALPGKRATLLREREMENAYLSAIDRPQNLIFGREAGAAWDLYTIGFYRDIKHFAASADVPEARREAAARAAGFEAADRIGTFLRTLIQSHHDTLATAVN